MAVSRLITSLKAQINNHSSDYLVPRAWTQEGPGYKAVNPCRYHLNIIESITAQQAEDIKATPGWTSSAAIYNMFVRTACAIDHDNDGIIGGSKSDPTLNSLGIRETGTFLKAIAMLQYIKGLGCNTIYLLPITTIGMASRKGALGSPYAIKNPFNIDENLADPLLSDLTVDEQFSAFTELAHHMGMKVVLEFVFRTSALDGDWVKDHPQWYYWIKDTVPDRSPDTPDGYGNPVFSQEELEKIKTAGEEGSTGLVRTPEEVKQALQRGEGQLVEPHEDYQNIFTSVPLSVSMKDHKWIGTLDSGEKVRIPGAFADWPPDDVQPPWTDVTYLRMYDCGRNKFNYVAYNTIRLYDPELAVEENRRKDLWDTIASIIPSYQDRFSIDGVMVDMGHALPVDLARMIQSEAKKKNQAFAFWEEKFFLDPVSPRTGYEAVVGPGIFVFENFDSCRQYLFDLKNTPAKFFATGENHNTPRLCKRADAFWSKAAWTIATFLPGSIPFIHNGMEIFESMPLNTGLCFSQDDIAELKDTPLGLFDAAGFDWTRDENLIDWIVKTLKIRQAANEIVSDTSAESFELMTDIPDECLGYFRLKDGKRQLAVIVNNSLQKSKIEIGGNWKCLTKGRELSEVFVMRPKRMIVLQAAP